MVFELFFTFAIFLYHYYVFPSSKFGYFWNCCNQYVSHLSKGVLGQTFYPWRLKCLHERFSILRC